MIFQSLVMVLPRFSTLKDHNKVLGQKLKTLRQHFVAMNIVNKWAKFHKDSLSGKKVKAGPPLDLSFWSFLTFLLHGIEEVESHLLWKFHKKFKGKVDQMCHRSWWPVVSYSARECGTAHVQRSCLRPPTLKSAFWTPPSGLNICLVECGSQTIHQCVRHVPYHWQGREIDLMPSAQKSISLFQVNVRSICAPSRLLDLEILTAKHSFDVLCVTETWLTASKPSSSINIPGYQSPIRKDRAETSGGGVAIYVRSGRS